LGVIRGVWKNKARGEVPKDEEDSGAEAAAPTVHTCGRDVSGSVAIVIGWEELILYKGDSGRKGEVVVDEELETQLPLIWEGVEGEHEN